jgi:hypothetical protein
MDKGKFDLSKLDKRSYDLGMVFAFTECVASGVKKIGLSPPQTEEEFKNIIDEIKTIAHEFRVTIYVDRDFLETLLFDPDYTRDKIVIHIAENQRVIDEYLALKRKKKLHESRGTLTREIKENITYNLGKLLSYSDEAIEQLIKNPRFSNN